MIYFDNAATTKYKPDEVIEALNYYLREVGVSPGREAIHLGLRHPVCFINPGLRLEDTLE